MLILSDTPAGNFLCNTQTHHQLSLFPVVLPRHLPNLRHIVFYNIQIRDLNPTFFAHMHQFCSVSRITCNSVDFATPYLLSRLVTSLPSLRQLDLGASLKRFTRNVDILGDSSSSRRLRHKLRTPCVSVEMQSGNFGDQVSRLTTLFRPASIVNLRMVLTIMRLSHAECVTYISPILQQHTASLRFLMLRFVSGDSVRTEPRVSAGLLIYSPLPRL